MWFVYALITFLIVIFSTSQLISFLVCFIRYPQLMEDMPSKNKRFIIGSMLLHFSIFLTWIILVCTISAIRVHYIAIIISFIIALLLSIEGITHDPSLFNNFKELTGYNEREDVKKSIEHLLTNYNENNNDTTPNLQNSNNVFFEQIKTELKNSDMLLSESKKQDLENKFHISCENLVNIQEYTIKNKKAKAYSFLQRLNSYSVGTIYHIVEVGVRNPRFFALEQSVDFSFVLCEWVFENGREIRHINYGTIIKDYGDFLKNKSSLDKTIDKIKEII